MFGLSALGLVHTILSLIAIAAGVIALIRDRAILPGNGLGRLYIRATVLACLTGFGLFGHGFGAGHVLGILTLMCLALAVIAARSIRFGRSARYIVTISGSASLLTQVIPGVNEALTRLPPSAPWFARTGDPRMASVLLGLIAVFVVGVALQLVALRASNRMTRRE